MVVSGEEIVYRWAPCVGKLADEAKWHREILPIMGKERIKLSIHDNGETFRGSDVSMG
jgi:hypothetical protein